MKDIADAADASVQTVYSSVGGKSQLVRALNNVIDAEAGIGEIAGSAMASGDPERIVALGARITRALIENSGDIIRVAVEGAPHEPELAEIVAEGHRRHVAGTEAAVQRLASLGVVSPSTDLEAITMSMAAVTDVALGLLLVDQYGWSLAATESWMYEMTRNVLAAARA